MIFGNPGVYDYDGKITYFAINVEKLFHAENNPPIIALNLLINLTYYPRKIATNIASVYLGNLKIKEKLFHQESEMLFNLSDKELLNSLIKNRYYDANDFPQENYFWDLDVTEYQDRGFYPYIVNYKDETRIIMISNPSNQISEFFDSNDWQIDSTILPRGDFLEILKDARKYIESISNNAS